MKHINILSLISFLPFFAIGQTPLTPSPTDTTYYVKGLQTGNDVYFDFAEFGGLGNTWNIGGNTIGELGIFGTIDTFGIAFRTNNANRMRITKTGAIGIGLTTPINNLDISGGMAIGSAYAGINTAPSQGLIIEGSVGVGTNNPTEKMEIVNATNGNTLLLLKNDNTGASARAGFALSNGSTGADRATMYLNGQNYTGVAGWSDRYVIQLSSGISNGMLFYANTGIQLSTSGTNEPDLKVISGNVGIGNSSPNDKLDVNGIIDAATGFQIGDSAPSGNYLRGNGTNFVSSAIQASDINSLAWMLGGQNTGATAAIGPTDAQTFNLSTGGSTRLSLSGAGKLTSGTLTDIQLTASDSVTLNASGSGLSMNSSYTRLYDGSNIVMQVNNSNSAFSWNVADNNSNAFVASVTGGGDNFFKHDSTDGAEVTTIGSGASGSTVQAAAPFIAKSYTHTEAGALTPVNGMIIYVSSTDATFTSVGIWAYENGAWAKL